MHGLRRLNHCIMSLKISSPFSHNIKTKVLWFPVVAKQDSSVGFPVVCGSGICGGVRLALGYLEDQMENREDDSGCSGSAVFTSWSV